MMEWLKHILTERDNQTFCPVRIGSLIAGSIYHFGAIGGYLLGQIHLDINTLGVYLQHMVTLIGVAGTTVGVKSVLKADAQ